MSDMATGIRGVLVRLAQLDESGRRIPAAHPMSSLSDIDRMSSIGDTTPTTADLLAQIATTRQADESARSRLPMGGEGE